jgi:hypothetical protein
VTCGKRRLKVKNIPGYNISTGLLLGLANKISENSASARITKGQPRDIKASYMS